MTGGAPMRGAEGATTAARMGRDGRPQGEAETDDRDWRRDGGRAGADGRRCAATAEEGEAADPRRADGGGAKEAAAAATTRRLGGKKWVWGWRGCRPREGRRSPGDGAAEIDEGGERDST